MSESTVVSASIYNPANSLFKVGKNERARVTWITCENDACPLLKAGQCVMVTLFNTANCFYGDVHGETGYTQRAGKFSSWIREQQERFKGVPRLKGPPNRVAFIGDYVYLPYDYMTMCEAVPFARHASLLSFGDCFLRRSEWTVDTMLTLIDFRPRPFMGGGEIKAYQRDSVPLFIQHVRELDPDMFAELVKVRPELDTEPDYVGRKAVLTTLNKPIEWVESRDDGSYPVRWHWDGKTLTTDSRHAYQETWGRVKAAEVCVVIAPDPGVAVEVRDNEWVNPETVFVD